MFKEITQSVVILALGISSVMAEWSTLEGEANDLQTGQLVYRERHSMAIDAGGQWVMESDYLATDGSLMAERIVTFNPLQAERPSYRLIDYRDNFEEGAEVLGNGQIELYRIIEGKKESALITPTSERPLVIDAGFSALIASEWDRLMAGQRITFDFASAARLTTIQFRLTHQPKSESNGLEEFILEPSNWFVRMLVSPIKLTYRSEDRALMSYEGLSNIRRSGGGNHTVSISFPPDHQFTMRQLPSA